MSLFDRLRRSTLPRALLIVATLLASQTSLACAVEGLLQAPGTEIAAAAEITLESGDCCDLCPDCASCGVCHASAAGLRTTGSQPAALMVVYSKLTFATAAPPRWAPATLLRPPIDAA